MNSFFIKDLRDQNAERKEAIKKNKLKVFKLFDSKTRMF